MFAPERGVENPIIRRAIELCEAEGMKVTYHEDTVEVWFSPDKKRFYTIWSQFLADAETVFGARLHAVPESAAPARASFGNRGARTPELAAVGAEAPGGFGTGQVNGHGGSFESGQARRVNDPAPAPAGSAAAEEIANLKRELKVLERAIRVVGMQSEEWKREVEVARQELESARAEMANMVEARMAMSGQGPDRYKQVRQIIIKRLHPDIAGTDDEKAYREKLFKSIWQDIETLDKRG